MANMWIHTMNLNSRKHGSKCLNGMISEFYESDLTKCKRGEISMKHKGKDQIPVEKRGFLGAKKNIMEARTMEVDDRTYQKMKKEKSNRPYSIEEMMLYDVFFFDD